MADNLFGSPTAHLDRFKTPVVPTRKKPSRFHPPPVLTVPDEMAEKIRQQRAIDAYQAGLETLRQWKGRLSAVEYAKAVARVEALK